MSPLKKPGTPVDDSLLRTGNHHTWGDKYWIGHELDAQKFDLAWMSLLVWWSEEYNTEQRGLLARHQLIDS